MRFPKLTSTALALLIAAVADVRGGVGNDDLFAGARADDVEGGAGRDTLNG